MKEIEIEKIRQIVCNQKSRIFDCSVPISRITDDDIKESIEVWNYAKQYILVELRKTVGLKKQHILDMIENIN